MPYYEIYFSSKGSSCNGMRCLNISYPLGSDTNISMSLFSVSFRFATDPKTCMFSASYFLAIEIIASFLSCNSSINDLSADIIIILKPNLLRYKHRYTNFSHSNNCNRHLFHCFAKLVVNKDFDIS